MNLDQNTVRDSIGMGVTSQFHVNPRPNKGFAKNLRGITRAWADSSRQHTDSCCC